MVKKEKSKKRKRSYSPFFSAWQFRIAAAVVVVQSVISSVAAVPSLAETTPLLTNIWPGISFLNTIRLGNSVLANSELLALADQQYIAPNGREHNSNLGALTGILFRAPPDGDLDFSSRAGATSHHPTPSENSAVLIASRALGLIRQRRTDPPPEPVPPPSAIRVICTNHRECPRCRGTLQIRRRAKAVWLLLPGAVEAAAVALHVCNGCGARIRPDLVEFKAGGEQVWEYDGAAEFLKVGKRMWASRAFCQSFITFLELGHVATSSFARIYAELYAPEPDWKLGSDHVWKSFVLHCAIGLATEADLPLRSLSSSTTEDIVRIALPRYLSSKRVPGALEHSCPECAHFARTWKEGKMPGDGDAAKLPTGKDAELVEHTTKDMDTVITMAVCDGINAGHVTCPVPGCRNEPENYRDRRFCVEHVGNYQLCGVHPCGAAVVETAAGEAYIGACADPAHQALWYAHVKYKGRENVLGHRRMIRQKKAALGRQGVALQEPWWNEEREPEVEGGVGDPANHGGEEQADGAVGRVPNQPKPKTMWRYGKIHCLEILVWACGFVISWDKFYTGEGEHEVLDFLQTTFNDPATCPSYLAFDRACRLMLSINAHDELEYLLEWFKLIVDAWHWAGHSATDILCQLHCNPAPLDGSAPNLVVPLIDPVELEEALASPNPEDTVRGVARRFRRMFNTEASEHLNSWVTGFGGMLARMKA
ncbi:hypothetical protein P7C70_g8965, partial [Phenoliferia sp. Uapishka_3]